MEKVSEISNEFRIIFALFFSTTFTKRLRKTTDYNEFKSITAQLLHTLPLAKELQPDW